MSPKAFKLGLIGLLTVMQYNCTTEVPSSKTADFPTYQGDIKPIFKKSCVSCHNDRWLDYNEVLAHRNDIKLKVIDLRQMPPFGLNKSDYETIKRWLDQGAKE